MTAADARCGLFAPPIGAALAASRAQARGATLRAGADEATVAAIESRANARVGATPCGSRDLAIAAARVRDAFEGYAKLSRMTYRGDLTEWRADRTTSATARWRLAQTVPFGWNTLVFGLAGREGTDALVAVADFPEGQAPYAARLVLRDTGRSLGPYLDLRAADAGGRLPLAKRLPPAGATRSFAAEARSPAGQDLLPKGMKVGWAFRFPAAAAAALAGLDPREAVAVEFLFAGQRDTVMRAYVEVGDFAAGRAFLQVAALKPAPARPASALAGGR